jgi:hypothetical protein
VLGITALVVLGSSLGHLAATPRLYGWTFAFNAPDNTITQNDACRGDEHAALGIDHIAGVGAMAGICTQPVQVENRFIKGYGFTTLRGTIEPEIISGRAPASSDEVALGATTLSALGKHIGDQVHATAAGHTVTYRIVGKAVIPRINPPDVQPLADGAIFTGDGLLRIEDHNNASRYVVGTETAGVSRKMVLAHINALPDVHVTGPDALYVTIAAATGPVVPPEINRLRQLGWFAPTLAALLATLALVAVGHAIVTGTRRRRRELALLKTLGFQRAQVRATVGWQATTIAAVGALVGVPAGILVGRVAWHALTNGLGITAPAAIPALALALIVCVGIAAVNIIAYVPARAAANLRPAIALRTE